MQSTKPSVSLHCYICSRGSTSGENAGTKQGQTVDLPERINHYRAILKNTVKIFKKLSTPTRYTPNLRCECKIDLKDFVVTIYFAPFGKTTS